MASTADFKNGFVCLLEGELYSIVEFQHFKMGRGGAYVRTKLRNLKTARVLEHTFRAGEKVQEAEIEKRPMQFLYLDGESLMLMDTDTYEQLAVPVVLVDSGTDFLKEGEKIMVLLYDEQPIGVELPTFVTLAVASTEPGLRGDTVSGATKKAVLETGGVVLVPLFVEEGELLKVDTRTATYIERVRK